MLHRIVAASNSSKRTMRGLLNPVVLKKSADGTHRSSARKSAKNRLSFNFLRTPGKKRFVASTGKGVNGN